MIYEWHTYVAAEGRLHDLLDRFANGTLALFATHDIAVVKFFKDRDNPGTLHYLTRFDVEASRDQAWANFQADEQWQQLKATSEAHGPLVASKRAITLAPTEFSPSR